MGNENAHRQTDSKVPFDISRAPHGLHVATALAKLGDHFERHYIKIKSDIAPSKNELAKIAEFILDAANRMPGVAATAFAGVKKVHNGKFWNGLEARLPRYLTSDGATHEWVVDTRKPLPASNIETGDDLPMGQATETES